MTVKRVDRLCVAIYPDSGTIRIEQTHRNGSIEIVGALEIDNEDELFDLEHAIAWARRRLFSGDPGK
jgi:hypothetical protein